MLLYFTFLHGENPREIRAKIYLITRSLTFYSYIITYALFIFTTHILQEVCIHVKRKSYIVKVRVIHNSIDHCGEIRFIYGWFARSECSPSEISYLSLLKVFWDRTKIFMSSMPWTIIKFLNPSTAFFILAPKIALIQFRQVRTFPIRYPLNIIIARRTVISPGEWPKRKLMILWLVFVRFYDTMYFLLNVLYLHGIRIFEKQKLLRQ